MDEAPIPAAVLARYRDLAGRPHRRFGTGLINRTYLVEGRRGNVVVQRLHPVFAGAVNEDIEAVTAHLAAKGLNTPRPLRCDDGALWVEGLVERPWRALSYVAGQSVEPDHLPEQAREAARLVASFHLRGRRPVLGLTATSGPACTTRPGTWRRCGRRSWSTATTGSSARSPRSPPSCSTRPGTCPTSRACPCATATAT
jgi:hypothetical protein